MGPQPMVSQPMVPQPRKLQQNDITIFESLGIEFFETLFVLFFRYLLANLTLFNKTCKVTLADNDRGIPPIHLRGGSILPISSESHHANSDSVRQKPLNLLVLSDTDKSAYGDLF